MKKGLILPTLFFGFGFVYAQTITKQLDTQRVGVYSGFFQNMNSQPFFTNNGLHYHTEWGHISAEYKKMNFVVQSYPCSKYFNGNSDSVSWKFIPSSKLLVVQYTDSANSNSIGIKYDTLNFGNVEDTQQIQKEYNTVMKSLFKNWVHIRFYARGDKYYVKLHTVSDFCRSYLPIDLEIYANDNQQLFKANILFDKEVELPECINLNDFSYNYFLRKDGAILKKNKIQIEQ